MGTDLDQLCTIKQACYTEKAGRTTIYKRIKAGHYVAYKIGGSTRLSLASIKAYRIRASMVSRTKEGSANV
jgi:excisionase family DNA binding protein